jgi:L-asparaginase/Glu-tRNA(Gln) amidotransferase subunit D
MTTRFIGRSLSMALAGLLLAAMSAGAAEMPRVRLLATGGTISNRSGGRLTADDLVKSIPNLDRYVRARRSSSPTRRAAR